MADLPYGGLDPSLVQLAQGGFAMPPPQQISTPEAPVLSGGPMVPSTPPPPPPQKIGPSAPQPDETPAYGLPPAVLAGVQSGFVPPAEAPSPGPVTSPSQVAAPQPATPSAAPSGPVTRPDQATALPDETRESPKQFVGDLKQNAVIAKQNAAFAASPEGIAQRAEAEQRASVDKERQANADASAAEQAQNDATAAALKAHADRVAQQQKIDDAKTAQDQANTQKYTQLYAQQIKDAADYKVDTNRDVGLRGMIAIALSGIGQALEHDHGPNTAFQMISQMQDKRIADQWAQKKALGEKAAGTKDVLGTYRANADDDRQAMQFQRAAEATKLADELRQVSAQYANPAAKAHAEQIAASLDQKSAAITMDEAQRKTAALRAQQEEADKKAQLAIAGGHLALARQESDRNFALKVAELEQNGDLKRAAQAAAAAKNLKESGVYDPATGQPLLDAAAAPVIAQVKQLEAKAAATTDPAEQAKLQKQASDLRTTAQLQYGTTLEDKEGKIKDKLAGAQQLINTTQRIRQALDDGSLLDRETRARLKTEADNAFTSWAELNGVKASSREYEVYKDAVGALDGYGATNVNKGPLKASLDALDTGTKNKTGTLLRTHGIRAIDENGNPWTPSPEKGISSPTISGQTSVERGVGAEPGIATKVLGIDLRHPLTGPAERNPINVENSGPVTPTGLTSEDDAKVLGLIRSYGKVSPDENERVVSSLSSFVSEPGDSERKQAIANAVLSRVQGENPKLYKQLLGTLPEQQRKERERFDAAGLDPSVLRGLGFMK